MPDTADEKYIHGKDSQVDIDGYFYSFGSWRLSWTTAREDVSDTSQKGVRTLPGDTAAEMEFDGPFLADVDDEPSLGLGPGQELTVRLYLEDSLYYELAVRLEDVDLRGDVRSPVTISLSVVVTEDATLLVV